MAKKSMKVKQQRKQKFSTREYSRCRICGRPHAYLSKYGDRKHLMRTSACAKFEFSARSFCEISESKSFETQLELSEQNFLKN